MNRPPEKRGLPGNTMPLLALVAGVVLLALEWREGVAFWSVFAVVLIVFAAGALVAGAVGGAGAGRDREP